MIGVMITHHNVNGQLSIKMYGFKYFSGGLEIIVTNSVLYNHYNLMMKSNKFSSIPMSACDSVMLYHVTDTGTHKPTYPNLKTLTYRWDIIWVHQKNLGDTTEERFIGL